MPTPTPPPSSPPRSSQVSIRRPAVMLVRIERDEEHDLGLESLGILVYRVRHPLPACQRIRVLRPEVILAGESVLSPDLAHLLFAAHETVAAVMPRTQLLDGARLREWVVETIEVVRRRRREALAAHVGHILHVANSATG